MSDAPAERDPWERMDGETDAAYARFLVYRNLGPARSLDAAYAAHSGAGATKGKKRQGAPGQWTDDSSRWHWPERAAAWDVAVLRESGRAVAVKFVALLDAVAARALAALADPKRQPRTFGEVVRTLEALGELVSEKAVQGAVDGGAVGVGARDPAPAVSVNVNAASGGVG